MVKRGKKFHYKMSQQIDTLPPPALCVFHNADLKFLYTRFNLARICCIFHCTTIQQRFLEHLIPSRVKKKKKTWLKIDLE